MILNMLTTGAMTKLGYVYGNLMVNVSPKNNKLVERAVTILSQAAKIDREQAREALEASNQSVPLALIKLKGNVSLSEAKRRLKSAKGNVRRAIESSGSAKPSGSRSLPRMR
jgi:N-acetylmuramic acid 6-phosphate etherase